MPLFGLVFYLGVWHLPSGGSGLRWIFDTLKEMGWPILLSASPCWVEQVPRYYWRHAGIPAPPVVFETMAAPDPRSCAAGGLERKDDEQLANFLAHHPDGIVLLYEFGWACRLAPSSVVRARAAVAAHSEWHPVVRNGNGLSSCLWVIAGAESADEVRSIAHQAGYPPAAHIARFAPGTAPPATQP